MEEKNSIGRKIARVRELKGIKQEGLAIDLGLNQQAISKMERSESIDIEMLRKIARALQVPVQIIENFDEQMLLDYFDDGGHSSFKCNFKLIDKVWELYERLILTEREKNDLLRQER
ncbi:helix-turn-helix domain-containing protein [Pedobacter sp. AW31-3R]|uniref:helix-turn-helix domain-containing protein n=1 Tax=Pedobacter sp. AW31-3R TaxID=3445781 RepID=UPI003FA02796